MKKPLTDEDIRAYVAFGGVRCPYCGGGELGGSSVNIDAGTASQEILCDDCGNGWFDIYTLTHMDTQ